MSTQEKLLKSLEILKGLSAPDQNFDSSKKKDKIQHCHVVTEAISNSTIKIAPNFHTYLSITIEVLLQLCDDKEADVRMTAGDCLNRIIRAMNDGNIGKVQIELHKGIKRNGPARSLRAALKRFSQLAHLIRPHKGKPYVVNLYPTLIKLSERSEEQIHETLANSLPPIMTVLGCFSSEIEIKGLLKAFLKNVAHPSAVIRRSATSCIFHVCINSKKPRIFLSYVAHYLLDLLVPLSDHQDNSIILGVLTCLKTILANLEKEGEGGLTLDKFLQIYELCLCYFSSGDHNVVNAALETTNVLFQNCNSELRMALTSDGGVGKSRVSFPSSFSSVALRSPSQLSVAASTATEECESQLTETIRSDIEKWIDESKLSILNLSDDSDKTLGTKTSLDVPPIQCNYDYSSPDYAPRVKSESIGDNLERLTLSDDSSERSFSYPEEEREFERVTIGSFLDSEVSLVYCARLLSKLFLLTGRSGCCISDKTIKVSVKSSALTCLSSIINIYPKVLTLFLDKNKTAASRQPISDVLLYENHPDPQLRGVVRMLLGNFLRGVVKDHAYSQWNRDNQTLLPLETVIKIIIKGLGDESSTCSRQTIISLSLCLEELVESADCGHVVPVLNALPRLATNPYWLVRVALCELVSRLPYVTVYHITGCGDFQRQIVDDVLFDLLRSEDGRVRTGAANAIVTIIPHLYHPQFRVKDSPVTAKAVSYTKRYLSNLCDNSDGVDLNKKRLIDNMPFPFSEIEKENCDKIEFSLSRVVTKLSSFLLTATSNCFISGCIEALSLLANAYPTTVYVRAWNCAKLENGDVTLDLFNICVHLFTHSTMSYDFTCNLHLLSLSSNLYAGYAFSLLKPVSDTDLSTKPWDMFSTPKFAHLTELYFNHLVKLFNILHYVLADVVPNQPQSKPVLANLATASPIKRRKSDLDKKILSPNKTPEKLSTTKSKDEESKDTPKPNSGVFVHLPHYMKIYEILKQGYMNYKVTLESEGCEKFVGLLRQILHSFAVLMEVGTLVEFQDIAEEILSYFRYTFILEAAATVECVQQLLKCLFGNNLATNKIQRRRFGGGDNHGFYYNVYQKACGDVAMSFKSLRNVHGVDCGGDSTVMGYLHRRDTKSMVPRSSDKILANYIRIFEPMVIKSLKHYTITSDVKLQCKVLQLLNQLIQLKVNYCLLDSEQIFIGFVLKQFDYIEKGQIPYAHELINKVFQFLVQLSHSKQHSKSIITVPKIIHLCDGLMASEQSPLTHCIPALEPIVENIFLTRNKSNTADAKELETTRDVVLSMLLRLYEHHEVLDLIILILDDSKYCNNSDKWLRWSTQVLDVILPMLKLNKIRLDNIRALVSLRRLIFVLEPSVFDSVDSVVLMLFQEPLTYELWRGCFTRHLAKTIVALLILSPLKEDDLIAKIDSLKANFAPGSVFEGCIPTTDPLNVLNSDGVFHNVPPEMIFARFLFKVLSLASRCCVEQKDDFLVEEVSILLMYCIHIFLSGSYCKITLYASANLKDFRVEEICENFLKISNEFPVLMGLWCYVLPLLNYTDSGFWGKATGGDRVKSINQKVVSTGSVILFCDFLDQEVFNPDQLSWFLNTHILEIVELRDEAPVSVFLSSIHRNSATSKIFVDSLMKHDLKSTNSVFITKLLRSLENAHASHTGSVVKLVLPELLLSPLLAISRSVANFASRKIELLLTMTMEEVHQQLAREDLLGIIKRMAALKLVKKHEALSSLLNKLCTESYDISPLDFDQKRSVDPGCIKQLEINKNWFLGQIREKCNNKETAQLLSRLSHDELITFLRHSNCNKIIFKECLRLGGDVESPLIRASVECLLEEVARICERIPKANQVSDFSRNVTTLFEDSRFLSWLYEVIPCVSSYINFLPGSKSQTSHSEILINFGVLCLESLNFLVSQNRDLNMNYIDLAVHCTESLFKQKSLSEILSSNTRISWLCSSVQSLYNFVSFLLKDQNQLPSVPKYGLEVALGDSQTAPIGDTCHRLYLLVTWLYKTQSGSTVPKFLLDPIRNIIISLSRLPVVNSYMLIPVQVWKSGWCPELVGPFHTQVPPLPIEFLQEVDILEEFIFRITLLGWTSRQQFEETWMCLLSVLCNNFEGRDSMVLQDVVHASSLAVKAITALLVQTLCFPVPGHCNVSEVIHVSRYLASPDQSSRIGIEKLRKIQGTIERKHNETGYLPKVSNVFKLPNLEKRFRHYSYGQMSVKYLLVATKTAEVEEDCQTLKMWQQKESLLDNSGLDINSCLQFLLDYYTQLLKNQLSTPLRFLHEIVRSTVIISDLFTDKSQFSWMLEVFLELSKVHTVEDELLHQYLIVGISKAVAVLTPDLETYETIKKILVQYLKSSFLPSRMACLHGLLYILEGCKLGNVTIGGISKEMQIVLPCAIEYVQCNLNTNNEILRRSQEHTVLVWTLAFFLIENIDENHLEPTLIQNTLQTAFSLLSQQKTTNTLQEVLMKALERLIIFKNSVAKNIGKEIMSLALKKTKSENPHVSILGVQLLLTYMYTDCAQQLEKTASQTYPDHLVQTMEKISAIFEHIKRGYVFEVEILCHVLPDILNDFFSPADILTKVIGEFLSPQQPHPKLLSGVVFQVFERAIEEEQLPLLQDWVVFSLSSFTQSLSVGMATWCLTCFFISASSNEWLRLLFPYVQTRVGRYEYEDRKMLCIAGADFYRNLTNPKQKETFVENFNKIKDQPDTLFQDLLSSL